MSFNAKLNCVKVLKSFGAGGVKELLEVTLGLRTSTEEFLDLGDIAEDLVEGAELVLMNFATGIPG